MTALLQVDKVEVVYKRAITAVQGVTLSVAERPIVAVLGTNAPGKTTTLGAISGFLGIDDARVTEGTITSKGAESTTERRTKLPEEASFWCRSAKRSFPTSPWQKILPHRFRAQSVRANGIVSVSAPTISSLGLPNCEAGPPGFSRVANGKCWRSARR